MVEKTLKNDVRKQSSLVRNATPMQRRWSSVERRRIIVIQTERDYLLPMYIGLPTLPPLHLHTFRTLFCLLQKKY